MQGSAQYQKIELQLSGERECLLSNLDIITVEVLEVYIMMAREQSPRIPKGRFRPAPAAAVVISKPGYYYDTIMTFGIN